MSMSPKIDGEVAVHLVPDMKRIVVKVDDIIADDPELFQKFQAAVTSATADAIRQIQAVAPKEAADRLRMDLLKSATVAEHKAMDNLAATVMETVFDLALAQSVKARLGQHWHDSHFGS
jgi:hypothetical protein